MKVWFTSDTHFGHANIIKYCHRPFLQPGDLDDKGQWVSKEIAKKRADEMDRVMIDNWNALVAPEDFVYHLGDFAMGDQALYRRQLNGRICFVVGNHDKQINRKLFEAVWDLRKIEVNCAEFQESYQAIVLCHYAMRVWNKSHRGVWHLYGHSHGTLPDDPNARSMDVGVDCNELKPFSCLQIQQRMNKKTFKPIDHHGE